MATANGLANLRPWTAEDRAARFQPFRTHTTALVKYIRAQTEDGKEMADFMLAVLRGQKIKTPGLNGARRIPSIRDRMSAADWLANRAFGMPKESVEVTESENARQERLTLLQTLPSEARQAMRAILIEALEAEARVPPQIAPGANGGPHA